MFLLLVFALDVRSWIDDVPVGVSLEIAPR